LRCRFFVVVGAVGVTGENDAEASESLALTRILRGAIGGMQGRGKGTIVEVASARARNRVGRK
jgi:hypothetical protein